MISLIFGPMYSGKTTEVLRRLERFNIAGRKTVLLRPSIDNRGFLSHSPKDVSWLEEIYVKDLRKFDCSEYDVIGVDEGQFHLGLTFFCKKMAVSGKHIIISALSATSECDTFDSVTDIIPYCDEIIKLNAVCTDCGSDAGGYTFYKSGKKTDKVKVGGKDDYTALCARCYFERRK